MDRRRFLTTAAATAALVAERGALAKAPLEGEARRRDPTLVELDWTPKTAAQVRVSADPGARPAAMRLLEARARGGRMIAAAPISPRPYFLVIAADGSQLRLAERLLPLQGGRNFRDLGGYRGAGGRQVRWGRIFRSGAMSGLTAADMGYLQSLGVRVICDLRSIQERTSRPNPFLGQGGAAPQVAATDYEMLKFDALLQATTRAAAIEAFAESYVDFTQALTPHYTDMFERLARGEAPLAMNCSAGKDRTGMAAALILSVLGVSRETVVADYALTQVYTPPANYRAAPAAAAAAGFGQAKAATLAGIPPEVLAVMGGSDPEVMRSTLAKVDARFGGPVALVKARYGVTDAKIARMRELYLA